MAAKSSELLGLDWAGNAPWSNLTKKRRVSVKREPGHAHFDLEVNVLECWEEKTYSKTQYFGWVCDLPKHSCRLCAWGEPVGALKTKPLTSWKTNAITLSTTLVMVVNNLITVLIRLITGFFDWLDSITLVLSISIGNRESRKKNAFLVQGARVI